MGTSPLSPAAPVLECDDRYVVEVMEKRKLLNEDHRYYFQSEPVAAQAQWEVITFLLTDLARSYPQHFALSIDGSRWKWVNHLLGESTSFIFGDSATLPLEPLDWVGRQVQEDLLLLDSALLLRAGQLCFASGWDLDEKMNRPFMSIHAPLPSVTLPMIEAANMFISRLPFGKTFQRNNWGFRVTEELDLSSRHRERYASALADRSAKMNACNAGDMVFVRIEHQTLTRLTSGFILFTIHTYLSPLHEEASNTIRANVLCNFLKGVPTPLSDYKLITSFMSPMVDYLEARALY